MSQYGEYRELRELMSRLGGTMEFYPGGGPGGVWQLELHGKVAQVECRNRDVNDLDSAYVPNTEHPKTWADFDEPHTLHYDAFWRLIDVIRRNEVAPEKARA